MAVGTGAETLQNIPAGRFVTDPAAFFAQTTKNVLTPKTMAAPGPGAFDSVRILQSGVVSKLNITFVGTLSVTTAAVTTSRRWPYGLISNFVLAANGRNDLYSCDGRDLHRLRFARYPSYDELVDAFPGSVGGGDSVGVGDYTLYLTWEVPIAMDDTTLVGSIFAQSSATNLMVRIAQETMANLFSANPGNAAIAGTFFVEETYFDIPFDAEGQLILPDLTRLHGFNSIETPLVAAGEQRVPLIASEGQLVRLFVSARRAANNPLSALPSTAAADKIDSIRIEYGGNKRPQVHDPAATLLSVNNNHYGAPLPYDALCFDFVRENPPRDVILLQGVTELAAVLGINPAVAMTAGAARVVQETLF